MCPDKINGVDVTPEDYSKMAAAIYDKLSNPDIIPLSYLDAWQTLTRLHLKNDGYLVLYQLMENIHPALNQTVFWMKEPGFMILTASTSFPPHL